MTIALSNKLKYTITKSLMKLKFPAFFQYVYLFSVYTKNPGKRSKQK